MSQQAEPSETTEPVPPIVAGRQTPDQTLASGDKRTQSKSKQVMLALLVVVLVLGVIGALLYVLTRYFGVKWSALFAVASALVAWLVRSSLEKRREYERLLNQEKREQYSQFLDVLNKVLPLGHEPDQEVSLRDLRKWSLKLMLVGSDEVIKAWNLARDSTAVEPRTVVRNYARLLLAMRRDAGQHHTKLTAGEMLQSFVNDLTDEDRKYIDRSGL